MFLPIGTQARFLLAAKLASANGTPLNTLLTLRSKCFEYDRGKPDRPVLTVPNWIDRFVQRLRKCMKSNGLRPIYIWAREAGADREHLHIAFHTTTKSCPGLVAFFEGQFGERCRENQEEGSKKTIGEFARGDTGTWHLAFDVHPDRRGHWLAAYLGKGEPSQRFFRGKLTGNSRKPARGVHFGGDLADERYDAPQGAIVGSSTRNARFAISKPLLAIMHRASCDESKKNK